MIKTKKGYHAEFKMLVTEKPGKDNDIEWQMKGCMGCLENAFAVAMCDNDEVMNVMRNALGKAVMYKMQKSMQDSQSQTISKDGIRSSIHSNLN